MKIKVLFICIHNSARSQIAEEYLRNLGGERFEVESAGYLPTEVNPLVIQVMKEEGIDLTGKKTQSVFQLYKSQQFYGYIITVCQRAKEENCPVFPGMAKQIHWDLENPDDYVGSGEERLNKLRLLRDKIKSMVMQFIDEQS
jgi:arsenate reductase (thioredoxin)